MRRRSRAGSEPTKARGAKTARGKTAALNRRNAPKTARAASSAAGPETELARLSRELHEAVEQQAATSEVLRIISASPGELEPVFRAVLENATRICNAKFGGLWLREEHGFRMVATHDLPPEYRKLVQTGAVIQPGPTLPIVRAAKTRKPVHIPDLREDQSYLAGEPVATTGADVGRVRSLVVVPMLKDREMVGAFAIFRQEVRPFTDKQIELLQNFAAQAVIAIENTRLLSELRESLEQQTATADVLHVISSSLGELKPVFQEMLKNAIRICEANFGFMVRYDGEAFQNMAHQGVAPAYLARIPAGPFKPGPETILGRVKAAMQTIHVEDLAASRGYAERDPLVVAAVELGGVRTYLGVPMIQSDKLVGVVLLYRQEPRLFSEKHVSLVQNFAAQAVIAIENTRLLSELRQSLEQQTATSEVLKVISTSPGELEPVFQSMLENATRICEASFGNLVLIEGNEPRIAAMFGAPPALEEYRRREPIIRGGPMVRMFETKSMISVTDLAADEIYASSAVARLGGARAFIGVPMLKDEELVGAITVYRHEVRPFTDKQAELLTNFAAQAVIAIENTRLLSELRESLDRQTATADILRVIAGTPEDSKRALDTTTSSSDAMRVISFASSLRRVPVGPGSGWLFPISRSNRRSWRCALSSTIVKFPLTTARRPSRPKAEKLPAYCAPCRCGRRHSRHCRGRVRRSA
jgi:GAF domain-containing protein